MLYIIIWGISNKLSKAKTASYRKTKKEEKECSHKKKSPLLKLLALGETTHLAQHVVFPLGESDYEARYRPAIESRHTSFGSNGNKLRFFFLEAIRLLGDDTAGLGFGKQIVIEVGAQDWERSVPVFFSYESEFFFSCKRIQERRGEGGGKGNSIKLTCSKHRLYPRQRHHQQRIHVLPPCRRVECSSSCSRIHCCS